ncbi:AAA family ATPase [Actinophytocola sp.]|uniref:AAA family ATPase n=1 Tax=Actinophytocola sp. TaxID=1872138 RepID=UPI002ED0D8F3
MRLHQIPRGGVCVLIGAPGAGKTTLAAEYLAAGAHVVSLDDARGRYGQHSGDQDATPAAVMDVVEQMIRLVRRDELVVLDATNVKQSDRAVPLGIARAHGVESLAHVLRTPLELCRLRNAARPAHRCVPDEKLIAMWHDVDRLTPEGLRAQGFTHVHVSREVAHP